MHIVVFSVDPLTNHPRHASFRILGRVMICHDMSWYSWPPSWQDWAGDREGKGKWARTDAWVTQNAGDFPHWTSAPHHDSPKEPLPETRIFQVPPFTTWHNWAVGRSGRASASGIVSAYGSIFWLRSAAVVCGARKRSHVTVALANGKLPGYQWINSLVSPAFVLSSPIVTIREVDSHHMYRLCSEMVETSAAAVLTMTQKGTVPRKIISCFIMFPIP